MTVSRAVGSTPLPLPLKRLSLFRYVAANRWLYLLLLPGMAYLLIFNYIPIYGVVIAFKKFSLVKGIFGSPWIGWDNFISLFQSARFYRVFRNSLLISFLRLLWGFPFPLLLALLMNEVRHMAFKRIIQTVVYVPHFISWVVIIGIAMNFLSTDGSVNFILQSLGGPRINFLIEPRFFRPTVIVTEIWKEAGWGTIIYLAAISGIDPQLYEAAVVDGASRFQRMRYITLPAIAGTIMVLLILRLGRILDNGFEQIYLLSNSLNLDVADVFETFAYRTGLQEGRYSFATAVGIFQSLIGLILLLATNTLSRRWSASALW